MNDHGPNGSSASRQFEEVLAQFLQAEEQGQRPDPQQWLERHPEVSERLRAFFHDREWFSKQAPRLAPTPSNTEPMTTPACGDGIDVGPAGLFAKSYFAGYEIVSELGKGGMGIVYKARQLNADRLVALKVIRTDRLEELSDGERRQWVDRFYREAQLVAALDQPAHIVSLYEVGERDSQPFFTMRLVEGGSLAQRLRDVKASGREKAAAWRVHEQRSNAQLLAQVARAVHYAHQRGILHRDLKPANILLDADGQPLVTDFGLARRLDETGSLMESAIEGTAPYMAPEQAIPSKGSMTTAADFYSLGAILYELLTGQPPFKGKNDVETLLLVVNQPPVAPRSLDRRLSRDLETICLKCLEKEPGRRYASAAALAEDLENWLAGRPIICRPVSRPERLWRWCRRNPAPTVAAGAVLAIAVIAFVLIADSRADALNLADEKGRLAEEYEGLAEKERGQKERIQDLFNDKAKLANEKAFLADEEHRQRKKVEWQLARETVGRGLDLCDRGEIADGVLWLGRGLELASKTKAADLDGAVRLNLAHWASRLHPMRATLRHNKQVSAAAFSPDGRIVVTGSKDGTARLWDAASGRPLGEPLRHLGPIWAVAFSPDGKRVVTGGEEGARLWDATTGRPVGGRMETPTAVWAVAFAADGRTLLTTSVDSVQLWDAATCKRAGPALTRGSRRVWPRDVAIRPDGKAVVMWSPDQMTRIWDPVTGKPIGPPLSLPGVLVAAAFSPDGRLLLTGSPDRIVRLWQADTGKLLRELPQQDQINFVAFGPDSRTMLTIDWGNTGRLWDALSGKLLATLAHRGQVSAVAFSPDGRALLTGSNFRSEPGGEARLWDVATGALLGPSLAHRYPVECVAFSQDGRTFLTGNGDLSAEYPRETADRGTAWLWQTADPPEGPVMAHDVEIYACAFSPNGKMLVTASLDGQVRLWNAASGEPLGPPLPQPGGVVAAAFGPDGKTLAVGTLGFPRGAQLWDVISGKPIGKPLAHPRVFSVAFSPDGKTVLTAGYGQFPNPGEARLWEAATGRPVGKPLAHRGPIYAAAWSRDGRTILTGSIDGTAQLWEAATGKPIGEPLHHKNTVISVAFDPEGKIAVTGSGDGTARLWNATTGKPIGTPLRHRGPVVAVAFSPNSRLALTGSEDGTARLWDAATGKPVGEPLRHNSALGVRCAAFSPDGRTILTGGKDGTVRLWETSTGLPVGPPRRHEQAVTVVAFSAEGRMAVTADVTGKARIWKLPPTPGGPASQVALWPEVLTGRRLDPDRVVRLIPSNEWARLARPFGEAGIPRPISDPLAWHRREARSREAAGQWFTAAWHLGRLIEATPDQPSLYSRRGLARLEMGEITRALADYTSVIELTKDSATAWFERGHAHVVAGEWKDAKKDLQHAVRLDPEYGSAWHHLGYARAALGEWKQAASDLAKAVKLPGSPAEALSHQALLCVHLQDVKGYRKSCQALLNTLSHGRRPGQFDGSTGGRQNPASPIPMGGAPYLPIFKGRTAQGPMGSNDAMAAWTCAVGRDSGVDPRMAMKQEILLSNSYARPYVVHRAVGAALYRGGEFRDAVQSLELAMAEARRNGQEATPTVWLFLAMAKAGLEQPDEARDWLKKARAWIEQVRKPKPQGAPEKNAVSRDDVPWTERVALEQLLAEAETVIEAASRKDLNPKTALAHWNLGNDLCDKGKVNEAIAAYRKAIALDPQFAKAHDSLGVALARKRQLDEAIACHRKAVELDPKNARMHTNLGGALQSKGRLDEAVLCHRKAVELDPKLAQAHGALGRALMQQGRFAEAETSTRVALRLLPQGHPLRRVATQQIQQCQHLQAQEKKLLEVLAEKVKPASVADQFQFARLCLMTRRYASGAKLYTEAFKTDAKQAENLALGHRYNAACAAVMAGCGKEQGERVADKEAIGWRKQALEWLRADLALWSKQESSAKTGDRTARASALRHWLDDSHLAGVRDKESLAKLPEEERKAWEKLWSEVKNALQLAGKR